MNIRSNRVKQKLVAGRVATILSGTDDPDLIDQLDTLGADGMWATSSAIRGWACASS